MVVKIRPVDVRATTDQGISPSVLGVMDPSESGGIVKTLWLLTKRPIDRVVPFEYWSPGTPGLSEADGMPVWPAQATSDVAIDNSKKINPAFVRRTIPNPALPSRSAD
jgi:hypothetical protein